MKNLPSYFIFPVLMVMFLDFLFTMLGQPENYWINPIHVNEGSPLGYNLLSHNPVYFVLFFIFYIGIAYTLLRFLPLFLRIVLGLSLFLGHVWGSSTWIYILLLKIGMPNSQFIQWYVTIGYLIFISIISALFIYPHVKIKK